ncbi:MAG: DUF1467 family protein [Hyphomicrobiales bacterium]|nr:DUF1467 family protein [Hyphomicrobiales bacterium]
MSIALAVAIYVICWWVILFAILPIGVRTQQEAGSVEPGTAESAPVSARLRAKLVATSVIAAIVFVLIYVLLVYKPIGLNDIPFLPQFDSSRGTQ